MWRGWIAAGFFACLNASALAAPNAASVEAGRRVFARCASCHEVGPHARHQFGPQLNGVLGRRSGSVAGYAYSDAIRRRALVWNETNLEAFIRDPDEVVPGTKMRFFGFFSKRQMADLMAYLQSQPAHPHSAVKPVRAAPGAAR